MPGTFCAFGVSEGTSEMCLRFVGDRVYMMAAMDGVVAPPAAYCGMLSACALGRAGRRL